MRLAFALPAALAAVASVLFVTSVASADDKDKSPATPPAKAKARVLVFGDGVTRFNVERDRTAGRMTFRLADPAMRIERAPVVVMTTESGPQEVTLTAVEGQPGAWLWTSDSVKAERFDGSMRIVVGGRSYTSPLTSVWTTDVPVVLKPRHGGRVLPLTDCGASVEVVQDPATGTLTIYSFENVVVTEAPIVTITESKGPTTLILTKVEGKDGVWMARNETFRTSTTSARIRLLVNGKACEAPLVYGSARGGQIVTVTGGPSFEVVRDPNAGAYTFYATDETIDGKPYTVENPVVVIHDRTYPLTRVEGEPRAWRLIGLDSDGSDSRDGQLNFTLFGKTLSTRLGLSGLGIDLK
jgi:hypothetical protein